MRWDRPSGAWRFVAPREKLERRAALPGAGAYDGACRGIQRALAAGVETAALMPLALSATWLVNNPTPSPIFKRWLEADMLGGFVELIDLLESPRAWKDATPDVRAQSQALVAALTPPGHGAGALSKVLALFLPERVPLMPDLAVRFVLGPLSAPLPPANRPDAQTASSDAFLPMMDAFAEGADTLASELAALSAEPSMRELPASAALDRLIWFESSGFRFFRKKETGGFVWIAHAGEEAVVPVACALGDLGDEPIALDDPSRPIVARALEALKSA